MSNNCFKYAPKMNSFKFDFSKIFWGGAHRAPSPNPSPRLFSGFALDSGFALNSRALRALDSGFALDTRALRALDSGFALNFWSETLVWPPQSKFLDPPLLSSRKRHVAHRHRQFLFRAAAEFSISTRRLQVYMNDIIDILKIIIKLRER